MIYTSNTPPKREYALKYYTTAGGDCPVKEMLDAMPLKHRAKTRKFFRLLEEKGPVLPRPYADAIRGKIRELVVDIQHHGYRFLHFCFLKKTPRTPAAEIERAERYMNDWLGRAQV